MLSRVTQLLQLLLLLVYCHHSYSRIYVLESDGKLNLEELTDEGKDGNGWKDADVEAADDVEAATGGGSTSLVGGQSTGESDSIPSNDQVELKGEVKDYNDIEGSTGNPSSVTASGVDNGDTDDTTVIDLGAANSNHSISGNPSTPPNPDNLGDTVSNPNDNPNAPTNSDNLSAANTSQTHNPSPSPNPTNPEESNQSQNDYQNLPQMPDKVLGAENSIHQSAPQGPVDFPPIKTDKDFEEVEKEAWTEIKTMDDHFHKSDNLDHSSDSFGEDYTDGGEVGMPVNQPPAPTGSDYVYSTEMESTNNSVPTVGVMNNTLPPVNNTNSTTSKISSGINLDKVPYQTLANAAANLTGNNSIAMPTNASQTPVTTASTAAMTASMYNMSSTNTKMPLQTEQGTNPDPVNVNASVDNSIVDGHTSQDYSDDSDDAIPIDPADSAQPSNVKITKFDPTENITKVEFDISNATAGVGITENTVMSYDVEKNNDSQNENMLMQPSGVEPQPFASQPPTTARSRLSNSTLVDRTPSQIENGPAPAMPPPNQGAPKMDTNIDFGVDSQVTSPSQPEEPIDDQLIPLGIGNIANNSQTDAAVPAGPISDPENGLNITSDEYPDMDSMNSSESNPSSAASPDGDALQNESEQTFNPPSVHHPISTDSANCQNSLCSTNDTLSQPASNRESTSLEQPATGPDSIDPQPQHLADPGPSTSPPVHQLSSSIKPRIGPAQIITRSIHTLPPPTIRPQKEPVVEVAPLAQPWTTHDVTDEPAGGGGGGGHTMPDIGHSLIPPSPVQHPGGETSPVQHPGGENTSPVQHPGGENNDAINQDYSDVQEPVTATRSFHETNIRGASEGSVVKKDLSHPEHGGHKIFTRLHTVPTTSKGRRRS